MAEQELEWHDADAPKASTPDYDKFITASAKRYDVPEHWIRTVIEHESKGNPKAWRAEPTKGEGVGSRGLMQLMPGTASGLGFEGEDFDKLYDPKTNIDLGTKYIGQLKKKYGDDFERVYSAYNSGDPDAYKTRPDVKAHVAKANEVFNQGLDWHDADSAEDQSTKLAEVTAAGKKAEEAATWPGILKTAVLGDLNKPDTGFVPGVVRNLRSAMELVKGIGGTGLTTDPQKLQQNMEAFRQFLGDPKAVTAAQVLPAGVGTSALETARRAESGDVGGAAADVITPVALSEVPGTLRAVGDVATTLKPSAATVKTAAKGAGKVAAATAVSSLESQIPGAGLPLSIATELLGIRGGMRDLVEAARMYKGDVYANKLAKTLSKKAEFIPSPTPTDIPSWQAMAGTAPPIDATPGAVIPKAKTGLPQTLGDFQQLTSGRQPLQLQAPTEGTTLATQTAPGEGGASTPSEESLPQIYRNVGPTTPAGTSATIVREPTRFATTSTPEEPTTEATPKAASKAKTEKRMPFKDWMKRMTPNQLKHVRAALDLVEDESKYDELQKAIDEATEK